MIPFAISPVGRMPGATDEELMGTVESLHWLVDCCLRVAGRVEENNTKPGEPQAARAQKFELRLLRSPEVAAGGRFRRLQATNAME